MEHLWPDPESVSGIVTVTAGVKNTAQTALKGDGGRGGGSLEDIFDAFILFHPLKSSVEL